MRRPNPRLRDSVDGNKRAGYVEHATTVEDLVRQSTRLRLIALRKKLGDA
jgi:hypothetical protein